jgi:hypothetical protein
MTGTITTIADAEAARDRVIAILRHELCYDAYMAHTERLVRDRNAHFNRAWATGKALEAVLRELGAPGDRSLPKPDGVLPLNAHADGDGRGFLGPAAADALLGKRPVL